MLALSLTLWRLGLGDVDVCAADGEGRGWRVSGSFCSYSMAMGADEYGGGKCVCAVKLVLCEIFFHCTAGLCSLIQPCSTTRTEKHNESQKDRWKHFECFGKKVNWEKDGDGTPQADDGK